MFGKLLTFMVEKNQYRQTYETLSGGKISDEYLAQGQVRAFYNRKNEMVAGYIINSTPNFRYIDYIPEADRTHLAIDIQNDKIMEITCIWIKKEKLERGQRHAIYLQLIQDCLATDTDYVLGGSVVEKIRDLQQSVLRHALWEGMSTKSQYQWVYFGKRIELLPLFLKKAAEVTFQLLRKAG